MGFRYERRRGVSQVMTRSGAGAEKGRTAIHFAVVGGGSACLFSGGWLHPVASRRLRAGGSIVCFDRVKTVYNAVILKNKARESRNEIYAIYFCKFAKVSPEKISTSIPDASNYNESAELVEGYADDDLPADDLRFRTDREGAALRRCPPPFRQHDRPSREETPQGLHARREVVRRNIGGGKSIGIRAAGVGYCKRQYNSTFKKIAVS